MGLCRKHGFSVFFFRALQWGLNLEISMLSSVDAFISSSVPLSKNILGATGDVLS